MSTSSTDNRSGTTKEVLDDRTGHRGLRTKDWAWMVAAAIAAGLLGWLIGPRPIDLGAETTGDTALASEIRELVGDAPYRGMAVAVIEDGQTRIAGLGTTGGAEPTPINEDTPFETGSVSKVFTGMLLAALEDEGRISRETTLGEAHPDVDFADPDVADVTFAELSNHLSGLPTTVPSGLGGILRTYGSTWMGINPFEGVTRGDVLNAAAVVDAGDREAPTYPNFGVALLGHAISKVEQSTYPRLMAEHLIEPLELNGTTVQPPSDDPPSGHARPQRSSGAPVEPWVGTGELPSGAGGLWSTASDLARLVATVQDGTAPGSAAVEPRYQHTPDQSVGLGWITNDYDGKIVTWHNGATDGTSSFVGFTDDAGVVVLATSGPVGSRSVDSLALQLIGVDSDQNTRLPARMYPILAVTLVLPLWIAVSLLIRVTRQGKRAQKQPVDRVGFASLAVVGVLILTATWRVGLWDRIPAALWVVAVAVFGAGLVMAIRRWPIVPVIATGRPWLRRGGLGLAIAATLAYGVLLTNTLSGLN